MNPFIEKNKSALVTVGIILISLLAAKKANDVNALKCDRLKSEIKNEEDKASALERIVGINERLKKLQERSWDTTNFEVVVQHISDLASAASIKVSTILPADKKTQDNYTSIPFSLVGETTYRNLSLFLKSIEKEKKLIELKEISLTPNSKMENGGQDVVLALTLTGEALYFK